jgi:putative NADH-flavin reductase
MRLTLFGATGRLGREVLSSALARGHVVTAATRNSAAQPPLHACRVTAELVDAISDSEAVILTFGARSPGEAPFCAALTEAILGVMRECAVTRLLCVTGAMVGHYPANRSWCFQHFAQWIQRRYPEHAMDRSRQEEVVRGSGSDWTIFKPPRLTMKPPGARLEAGGEVRVGLLSSVARSNLAQLMVEELDLHRFSCQAVFVKTADGA